jgi:uncharacterized membrane protein YraQ (UPF0718 family)
MTLKTWAIGDVLTAADLNTYVSQQVVGTFGSSAIRATAIATAVGGQVSYLTDRDRIEHWDGATWQPLPSAMTVFSATGPATAIAAGSSALVSVVFPTSRFGTIPIVCGLTTTGAYLTPVLNTLTGTGTATIALVNNGAVSQAATVTLYGVAIMMSTGTATG